MSKRGILGAQWINVLQISDSATQSGIGHRMSRESYHELSTEHTTDLQVNMYAHMQTNTPLAPNAVMLTLRVGGTTRSTKNMMDIRANHIEHI